MVITIKKASIRGSLFLNYEFEQQDNDVKNLIKTSSDAPIHDDLRKLFRQLIPHFAFICEEVKDEKLTKKAIANPEQYLVRTDGVEMDETFLKYRVSEFSIYEKKGFYWITLSGAKALATGDEINFSTPAVDADSHDYKFISELNTLIEELKEEVHAYMNGKQAPKAQLEMFGEENSEVDGTSAFVTEVE